MTLHGDPGKKTAQYDTLLRVFALSLPRTKEDKPWNHSAYKVAGKTFVFVAADATGLSVGVKLIASHRSALKLPYAEPTAYGLGKSGWVSVKFAPEAEVPLELLKGWIRESFAAIAPKSLGAVEAGKKNGSKPSVKRVQKKTAKRVNAVKKKVRAKRSDR